MATFLRAYPTAGATARQPETPEIVFGKRSGFDKNESHPLR